MKDSASEAPITFVVPGQAVSSSGATRGAGQSAQASGGFADVGMVSQRVQVGARRGVGSSVRLTAQPGRDVLLLHIANGPSLMLHPATARDLLMAQSGRSHNAVQVAQALTRGGAPAGEAMPDEIDVPAQLGWQGLENTGAVRGATRGRLGDVLLTAVELVTGRFAAPAAKLSARKLAEVVDAQVDEGVYHLPDRGFEAALKGRAPALARLPLPAEGKPPLLILLHGTFTETHSTFGALWLMHPLRVRELYERFAGQVYAFDHRTLGVSPIDNALVLARTLPDGARVQFLTHSRGGLVGEVLALVCADPARAREAADQHFGAPAHAGQRQALRQLADQVDGRGLQIERLVRVACPARGTLLASGRLDAFVSVLKWTLELARVPVVPSLLDFIAQVAAQRTDPNVWPGLEAMLPDCALVQWLNAAQGPLPGQLRVVAGDMQGDSIGSWVKTLLADGLFWTDNDMVVQTRSMYGGAPRAPSSGQAGASCLLDQNGGVSHFNYFGNERTAAAVCSALMQELPAEFRPIGPLAWAGRSTDGHRAGTQGTGGLGVTGAADRPALIVVPGLLGSHLRLADERLWLSQLTTGRLDRLAYAGQGTTLRADGRVNGPADALLQFLSDSHELIEFSFDWRAPLELAAEQLAELMAAALAARQRSAQPVRLLALSVGGLVARSVQLQRPEVWATWQQSPGSRMLMLGTPNAGCWVPMQTLSGDEALHELLAAFSLPGQMPQVRQWLAEMPGFMQLQAGLLDDDGALTQEARWRELAQQDRTLLEDTLWWHTTSSQRKSMQWGLPPRQVLEQAAGLWRRLDGQLPDSPALFGAQGVMVVGQAGFTAGGYELDPRDGLAYLDVPEAGDGRVTLASALLPGVPAWQVDATHDELAQTKGAFEAYLDLLTEGRTTRLKAVAQAATPARGQSAAPPAAELARVRSRPSRVRRAPPRPPASTTEMFEQVPLQAANAPASQSALRVSVLNANLKFASKTLMLGHYAALSLTGAEYVVDLLIGGAMSASLATGLYPEATGTHQVFVNSRQDPDNPLALPRPPHVVVVGLGEEGKLRSAALTHSVCQATLAWAQRLAQSPAQSASHFALSATLIGSGGSGITVSLSAQAMAQGVREANQKLAEGGWPQVSHLQLVELYLDRATEAWRALQLLCESSPEHFVLPPTVAIGTGALRGPISIGYRGAAYDFISAVTERDEDGEPKIVYTLDTKRARSEVRAQATQSRLVGELVSRASNEALRDGSIGRTLFQLLVPVEMEATLGGSTEMLLELDDGTAAIPWELLNPPQDGRGEAQEPWALRSKLLRKLRTVEYRSQVRDARIEDDVLVIGEPLCDATLYPPLPGARLEAEAVHDALSGQLGLEASRVHALIAPGDGLGPDAAAVTSALLARRYRIVHIAGHGEPELLRPGQPPLLRGVVLSNGTFLGPREVAAMRVVPELVFLNCCHLAADAGSLLKPYDRASFAAGVAKQLIRIGVRCVVAAGWAVEDTAASDFAMAFYRALLSGQRFMDAVDAGRRAARTASPLGNTWAAYQCYGDPDWVWRRSDDDPQRPPSPVADEFTGVASPVALALALETLVVRSRTQGAKPRRQLEKIHYLESRFAADWGGMGAVAEAFSLAYAAAADSEPAIAWAERAVNADDGSATFQAAERLANLRARHAWQRVHDALKAGAKALALAPLFVQGREQIAAALVVLNSLVAVSTSVERESLLGSACKRLALLEGAAGDLSARDEAVARMAQHYRRAEALALQRGYADMYYPALNRMAAELVDQGRRPGWPGFAAAEVERVRQNLTERDAEAPDFWNMAGKAELSTYVALSHQTLAQELKVILAAYDNLHQRAGSQQMWRSVLDQAGFALQHFDEGQGAQAAAARSLLKRLESYTRE